MVTIYPFLVSGTSCARRVATAGCRRIGGGRADAHTGWTGTTSSERFTAVPVSAGPTPLREPRRRTGAFRRWRNPGGIVTVTGSWPARWRPAFAKWWFCLRRPHRAGVSKRRSARRSRKTGHSECGRTLRTDGLAPRCRATLCHGASIRLKRGRRNTVRAAAGSIPVVGKDRDRKTCGPPICGAASRAELPRAAQAGMPAPVGRFSSSPALLQHFAVEIRTWHHHYGEDLSISGRCRRRQRTLSYRILPLRGEDSMSGRTITRRQ